MGKVKSTKRALIFSVLALLVCVSMLIGTTFAWFTDSVASGRNTIQSGNLDVELYYSVLDENGNWTTYAKVTPETDIFGYNNWEPGYTSVAKFKVVNKGSLALKYQLTADVYSEIAGKNAAGDSLKLSDFLRYGVTETLELLDGRDTAAAVATNTFGTFNVKSSSLAKNGEAEVGVVITMPTGVGNEANHNGVNVPSIEFGINLVATQEMAEADSFGIDYDNVALVSSADELKDAIAQGKNVVLTKDVEVEVDGTAITVGNTAKTLIDLNGKSITAATTKTGASQKLFVVNGELEVVGSGTIALYDNSGATFNSAYLNAPISVEGGVVTLGEGVNVICESEGNAMAYAVDVNTTLGEAVLNVDGAMLMSDYIGVRVFKNNANKAGIVNYNSGIIYGAKNGYDIWTQNPGANGEAIVNVNADVEYTYDPDKFGGMYYFADEVSVVFDGTDFAAAAAAGGEILLAKDIAVSSSVSINNKDLVLDGNGHIITLANANTANIALLDVNGGSITIKNTVFDGVNGPAILRTVDATAIIDNVIVENSGNMATAQGMLRLLGDATVTNCTFKNNNAKMIITFCFDMNEDVYSFKLENSVFENNVCNDTGVVYYVHGTSAVINNNKFIGNTINSDSHAAVIYSSTITIMENEFNNNVVNAAGARAGVIVIDGGKVSNNNFSANDVTTTASAPVYKATIVSKGDVGTELVLKDNNVSDYVNVKGNTVTVE